MLSGRHIALVEDDDIMGASILQRLELEGARVVWFKSFHRALGGLRTPHRPFDAVVCDIRLADGSGEDLFNRLCETGMPPPFLFMTAHGQTDQAVRLLQSGAADYLTKPFEMATFLDRLRHVILPGTFGEGAAVFGISPAARRIEAVLARLAALDGPVLIRGETGTGKRLAAQRLHALSDRRAAPFVALDLSRLAPEAVAERLFGPEGALASAGEGVLLLERIAEAAPEVQARLTEAIWAGGPARIVVTEGSEPAVETRLRPDLFYHLATLTLTVPPLRDRPEDAVWLLARLFHGMNARRAVPLKGISARAEEAVRQHEWPGNGRELRSRLARAMALAEGPMIFPADLFPETPAGSAEDEGGLSLAEARERAERRQIARALDLSQGNMADAARLLQISRTTLWEKMQKLGL
ncbi:ArxR, response regulator (plasmid) [Cereibacter azotoformans]|uniref:sigma-54-dependent transcriptional regulator n=1 Tax=Cereibacter azotoformans TaxID=43057 RepID=UPI001EECA8BD|nr:response regulator [Cereibacter azotoformans]ULB12471.1 ArxR, response regulator [Cereibacter azotoformans]